MNRTGRKILLGVLVIAAFVGYTIAIHGQKNEDSKVVDSSKPAGSSSAQASAASSGGSSSSSGSSSSTNYKNGTYTGSVEDAFYGNIQVEAIISGGKISDVQFLQYPNDNPNSQSINQQAMPLLKQEAIQAQSAQVDTVTGATDTSQAFVQSLTAALNQAQA